MKLSLTLTDPSREQIRLGMRSLGCGERMHVKMTRQDLAPDYPKFTGFYSIYKLRDDRVYWKLFGIPIPMPWTTAVYRFVQNPIDPLTLWVTPELAYRPRPSMDTDMATIPLPAQIRIQKDRYLLFSFVHDSGYLDQGLNCYKNGTWSMRRLPKSEVDGLAFPAVKAEGGPREDAELIFWGVDHFGKGSWDEAGPTQGVA